MVLPAVPQSALELMSDSGLGTNVATERNIYRGYAEQNRAVKILYVPAISFVVSYVCTARYYFCCTTDTKKVAGINTPRPCVILLKKKT